MAIQLADEIVVMTANKIVQDNPCKLIENGVFNEIFNDENIIFDSNKGKFVIT